MVAKNIKFNLIVAVCKNNGIGINGDLPWFLPKELRHFSRMTKKTVDPAKQNAIIMGRKTYFGVPEEKRPLRDRMNVVLSRNAGPEEFPDSVVLCRSMAEALERLEREEGVENVWIVGGNSVYKEAIDSGRTHRIYLTRVLADFECDAFFPEFSEATFKLVPNDDDIPTEVQEENGIRYEYQIYEAVAAE